MAQCGISRMFVLGRGFIPPIPINVFSYIPWSGISECAISADQSQESSRRLFLLNQL